MSIAINCPECSAEFDVQDNLAGKTIRCSSCKTQMTVPQPAAAGAKKPFGWKNSETESAEDVAEVLEIDDDTPEPSSKPAKVTKPAPPPAKPAAKKASREVGCER
jgi:predicted Zn finger-like uncharacterized protein